MMTAFQGRDPASLAKTVGVQGQSGVAAGTGDNTELTSAGIDRMGTGVGGFLAAILAVTWKTSLTAAATLNLTVKISESDDNSSWGSDTTLINAEVQATGAQTNLVGTRELGLDLTQRKRYIRFKITMDLSAGATDTFVYGATLTLVGADRLPQ